jgi:two-component system osmolarity sensor histidine kinase EnvZ
VSLRWRIIRHFVLLTLLLQILILLLHSVFIGIPLLKVAVNDFASLITVLTHAWLAVPPVQRSALTQQYAAQYQLTFHAQDQLPKQLGQSCLPYPCLLEARLALQWGPGVHVGVESQTAQYWITLTAGAETVIISFPHQRIGSAPMTSLLASLGGSMLLALAVAWYLARRLTRPLPDLLHQVRDLVRGATPRKLTATGTGEIDALATALNQLAGQLREVKRSHATMLAGVSHDLCAPLARLRMVVALAREQPNAERFAAMERYLIQMERLVRDFLEFSQGVGRQPPVTIALQDLFAVLAVEFRVSVMGGTELAVWADHGLARVLCNLLENAQRYSPENTPVVLEAFQADGWVVIEVRDSGPGIPPSAIEQVFKPFVRLNLTRSLPQGSGLGLAIAHDICQMRGWTIRLTNRLEGGLCARLTVPFAP